MSHGIVATINTKNVYYFIIIIIKLLTNVPSNIITNLLTSVRIKTNKQYYKVILVVFGIVHCAYARIRNL